MKKSKSLLFILLVVLFKVNAAVSSPQYIQGKDTLVVYNDVPGLTPSGKYNIRVRSAATNNVWVDVFAHYTYNRALELPDINQTNGTNSSTSVQHYPTATGGWSQTYGNIEMSNNQPVEVEISAKNGFKIAGKDFFKATVHPAQKASAATVSNGKVYFTISNPVQVAIDINGQMDDYNAFVNPIGAPTHTITLFTNPILKKPTLTGTRVHVVEPGTDSVAMNSINPATYDTLYFKPGVHNIGMNFKIYPGKGVYIPGDAIIYGSINNFGVPQGSYVKIGEKIKIFGYGTISGLKSTHPNYVLNLDPNYCRPIAIDKALNYQIIGVTVADPANFSVYLPAAIGGSVLWTKIIGWRANGDGLGDGETVNDCFVRSNDDCSYVRGNRKRVTYWKDNISAIFYMSKIYDRPLLIEDCDVLYCRSRGGGGAAWDMRVDIVKGVNPTQATFRNIRFHDPRSNMEIFNLTTFKGDVASPTSLGGTYNWIKFENISIASSSVKSNLLACASAPWNGGLTFDNVTFGGNVLIQSNLSTFFNTNSYVTNMTFGTRTKYSISASVNGGAGGTIVGAGSYANGEAAAVSAYPASGYKFINWTENGVAVSTNISYNFTVSAARNLVANFEATNYTLTETSPNGYVTFNPAGGIYAPGTVVTVTAVPNSGSAYVFNSWGGALSGSTNPTTITMNSNKSISASFTTAPLPDVSELGAWVSGTTNDKIAGNNRLMIVMVMGESNVDFGANSVTYGGQTMVKQTEKLYYVSGNRTYASIFTLNEAGVNAATSGTIAPFWSTNPSVGNSICSVLLSNVDQTTPVGGSANNALTGTSITTSALDAAAGDMVFMCGATENNVTQAFNNEFDIRFESNTSWGDGVGGNKLRVNATETPSFTQSASGRMALCAIVVKKASIPLKVPSLTLSVFDKTNTSDNTINIYPNPVSTMLTVDFFNADISREVKVYTIFGQLVYSTKTQNSNVQINVQSLNIKGILMVQVIAGNSVVNHRILVK